jgi:hypothetical protein
MTAQSKIADYYEARAYWDRVHAESSAAHTAMKRAETEAVEAMLDEDITSIGRDDGTHVSLRKQFLCSVTEHNEDRVREWLTEVEGDDAQFVVEKVHKPALVEWMKDKFEQAVMDEGDVPEFLKFTQRPALTVRGWKTRKAENPNG